MTFRDNLTEILSRVDFDGKYPGYLTVDQATDRIIALVLEVVGETTEQIKVRPNIESDKWLSARIGGANQLRDALRQAIKGEESDGK